MSLIKPNVRGNRRNNLWSLLPSVTFKSVKKTFRFITNTALRITIHASYSHLTNLLVQRNTHCLIKDLNDDRLNITNWSWRTRGSLYLAGATDVDREVWNYVFKCQNVDFCITRLSARKNAEKFSYTTMEKHKKEKKNSSSNCNENFYAHVN